MTFHSLLYTFLASIIALFPVMNILGNGFVVNASLGDLDEPQRKKAIKTIIRNCLMVGQPVGRTARAVDVRAGDTGDTGRRRDHHLPHRTRVAQQFPNDQNRRETRSGEHRRPPVLSHLIPHLPGAREHLGDLHADGRGVDERRDPAHRRKLRSDSARNRSDGHRPLLLAALR